MPKQIIVIFIVCLSCRDNQIRIKLDRIPGTPNRLINETSPYLLQHANNPVDWYPWGEKAFNRAKEENKPVFLSIGYAACHWCHVMEKESFENDSIAAFMNAHFISIKVDREERPDIDQLYMHFVQMTTGSGGWPMSVFITPEGQPFYGGTYFPPDDRFGRPGFKKVLTSISDFYTNKQDELRSHIAEVDKAYLKSMSEPEVGGIPSEKNFDSAVHQLSTFYEPQNGGIGKAPKFPAVQCFQLFLRYFKNTGDERYLKMTEHTLTEMGEGGICDQLGGGFARYSVDNEWLVPHFEKMLYDNGQLCNLYLDVFKITKKPFYLTIAKDILGFVSREMLSPDGGFYSSLDADSEGEEGKFYTWTMDEIIEILGKNAGDVFCARYDVTETGNFEHKNILRIKRDLPGLARQFNTDVGQIEKSLENSKKKLLKAREGRIHPGLDDKIIVSWNGLMLSAFARIYQVTQDQTYSNIIRNNINFLSSKLWQKYKLYHTYKDDIAKFDAFLDDYAFLISGLIDSYEALFDESYLVWAKTLIDMVNIKFRDHQHGGYFYTSSEQEALYKRIKDESDQSIPSGTGIMVMNLLRMYYYNRTPSYLKRAEDILKKYGSQFESNPYGYASFLNALDFYLQTPREILIVSANEHDLNKVLQLISNMYLPDKIVILAGEKSRLEVINPEYFDAKTMIDSKTTVYVCRNFVCQNPVIELDKMSDVLK